MLKSIVEHTATKTSLTVGTDLFAGWLPPSAPAMCTAVLERDPGLVDPERTGIREYPLQLWTRSESYHDARTRAHLVFDALMGLGATDLTDCVVQASTGFQPAYVGQDELGRHEFSANVVLRLRVKET